MIKRNRLSRDDINSQKEITEEVLVEWFVKDCNGMNRVYSPVTKIKKIMQLLRDNYDRRESNTID
jgi:hypothetical protein